MRSVSDVGALFKVFKAPLPKEVNGPTPKVIVAPVPRLEKI